MNDDGGGGDGDGKVRSGRPYKHRSLPVNVSRSLRKAVLFGRGYTSTKGVWPRNSIDELWECVDTQLQDYLDQQKFNASKEREKEEK